MSFSLPFSKSVVSEFSFLVNPYSESKNVINPPYFFFFFNFWWVLFVCLFLFLFFIIAMTVPSN